jgi:hypothetical protein
MTLAEAKKQSIERWEKIIKDIPEVKIDGRSGYQPSDDVYGKCGFCEYKGDLEIKVEKGLSCFEVHCPLYPCDCCNIERRERTRTSQSTYWMFVAALNSKNEASMRKWGERMLAAIKAVEV